MPIYELDSFHSFMNCVHKQHTDASRLVTPRAAEVLSPEQVRENNLTEDERDSGSPDPHDDADFGLDQAAQQHLADGALDPLATFIKKLEEHDRP